MQWKAVSQAAKKGYSHLDCQLVDSNHIEDQHTCQALREYLRYVNASIPTKKEVSMAGTTTRTLCSLYCESISCLGEVVAGQDHRITTLAG